jgi:hypothetical protein
MSMAAIRQAWYANVQNEYTSAGRYHHLLYAPSFSDYHQTS